MVDKIGHASSLKTMKVLKAHYERVEATGIKRA